MAEERAAFEAALKAEVFKLTARFNLARKLQERERNKVVAELASVSAQARRLQLELESERAAWQIEASRATEHIERLERELALAYGANSAAETAASRERRGRFWVMGAALTGAMVLVHLFGW